MTFAHFCLHNDQCSALIPNNVCGSKLRIKHTGQRRPQERLVKNEMILLKSGSLNPLLTCGATSSIFTVANARRFYSSMGDLLVTKG